MTMSEREPASWEEVEEEPSERSALRRGLASEASMWLWAAEVGRRIRGRRREEHRGIDLGH